MWVDAAVAATLGDEVYGPLVLAVVCLVELAAEVILQRTHTLLVGMSAKINFGPGVTMLTSKKVFLKTLTPLSKKYWPWLRFMNW